MWMLCVCLHPEQQMSDWRVSSLCSSIQFCTLVFRSTDFDVLCRVLNFCFLLSEPAIRLASCKCLSRTFTTLFGAIVEDKRDLLNRQPLRLGEIEVDDDDVEAVNSDVDSVVLPSDSLQSNGVYELIERVCQVLDGQIDRQTLCAEIERHDLRTV